MRTRFLLGPAGSGKTYRCLAEIRAKLEESPDGAPLVLLAPKQATFQLERQLLATNELAGYSRLQILSFERLARFVFQQLNQPLPELLTEEGRVMVLRALLEKTRDELQIFRSSARLPGFAQQLSLLLRELQNHRVTAEALEKLIGRVTGSHRLQEKLRDLQLLVRSYRAWFQERNLHDGDLLLGLAADALSRHEARSSPIQLGGLWLDGFAQMTPEERLLLRALVPHCAEATFAFCLPSATVAGPWHSPWSLIGETYLRCREELATLPNCDVEVEVLPAGGAQTRFASNPALHHLEQSWAEPQPFKDGESSLPVRIVFCPTPEAEATLAAREILRFVRSGGRFRDVAVLVRHLDAYQHPLRRVFRRYQIPFFLDRREPVAHHPLAELTRNALRTVVHAWRHSDWFGVLKSGLVPADESMVDVLENTALARGWEGSTWQKPLVLNDDSALQERLEPLRQKIIGPFNRLAAVLAQPVSGLELAQALRQLWSDLGVSATLENWMTEGIEQGHGPPIHRTVWEQMQAWLDSLGLAFADVSMRLRDWIPILEAGLSSLTIGVIPPVLDQVLLGSVDRSRNPDLKQVFVLGLNETVFPAPPAVPTLLTAADREALAEAGYVLGPDRHLQIGHERFYGYISCTRAREKVVLTYAARDATGTGLHPSYFVSHLQRMFPTLAVETFETPQPWIQSEHAHELVGPLLQCNRMAIDDPSAVALRQLQTLPLFQPLLEQLGHLRTEPGMLRLSPRFAEQLYGPALDTSVSRLEQFAACPFRFFINSGLQAEERSRYELDAREQGRFQHEVLARFHQSLQADQMRWRELTVAQARERIGRIADALVPEFEQGLLLATAQNQFLAASYKDALQQFIETIIDWSGQYEFDPVAVEIGFGLKDGLLPAWQLDLKEGHLLRFRGRIDRVDLWRQQESDEAFCVVVDYKASLRKVDLLLLEHGIQQQLPGYLNVLRQLPDPQAIFGVKKLIPAGVFYVNLRGEYQPGANREEVLGRKSEARKKAYRHQGLFNLSFLRQLDNRPEANSGDQFDYRLTKAGALYRRSKAGMNASSFEALLDDAALQLVSLGRRIYSGEVRVDPYKKNRDVACRTCDYKPICRIDPWTHQFRILRHTGGAEEEVDE